jgi:hypothetical protein
MAEPEQDTNAAEEPKTSPLDLLATAAIGDSTEKVWTRNEMN